MALPLLPGNSFNLNIGRTSFNRPQKFAYNNDVQMEMTKYTKPEKPYSFATTLVGKPPSNPSWIEFDKYVLCFDSFYREPICTSPHETFRYRRCKILYYLEDDSMQIVEPPQRNSGITQEDLKNTLLPTGKRNMGLPGTFIHRHRFPKPNQNFKSGGAYYTLKDLNIGTEINIYGHIYRIINCDKFTRHFLTEAGIDVKDSESEPYDPYTQQRKEMDDHFIAKRPLERKDKLGQFLKFHPKVLRFYCVWDDRKSLFGDERKLVLHYYLDDDTVEIIEQRPPNSGRCDTNVLLHRSPLPKMVEQMPKPGEMAERTVLNIAGMRNNDKLYDLDNHPVPERKITYYNDSDFAIGKTIKIYNRDFFLYDCDDFTKMFYLQKYGTEMTPMPRTEVIPQPVPRLIYPHNIFGSAEDSIGNCFYIIPRPPRKDLIKFYQKDKIGMESNQLRFAANVISDDPITKSRVFVTSFFLGDDTLQVHEPHQDNSGIMDGKHMRRLKVMKPESPGIGESGQPIYYGPEDMFIGNVIYMRGNAYMLFDADEYTFDYMEKHPDQFVHANLKAIMAFLKTVLGEKTQTLKAQFESVDKEGTGFVPYMEFRRILYENLPEKIPEHQVMTVGRFYSDFESVDVKFDDIISIVQTKLRKRNFSDFERLSLTFQEYDVSKLGYFEPNKLYIVMHAYPLPLEPDALRALIYKFPRTDCGGINYGDVLNTIDWQKNPVPFRAPIPSVLDINWKGTEARKAVERFSYIPFIEDILYGLRSYKQ